MQSIHDVLAMSRLLLAATFATAAVTTVADSSHLARGMLVAIGAPPPLARAVMVLLPAAELAIALALVSHALAFAGDAAALVLLLGFIAVIGRGMSLGLAAGCRCFGALSGDTMLLASLMRAQALAAVAALVLWLGWADAGPSVVAWISALAPHQKALVGGGVAAGVAVLVMPRVGGKVGARLAGEASAATGVGFPAAGLAIGSAAPVPSSSHGSTLVVLANGTYHPQESVAAMLARRPVRTVLKVVDVSVARGRAIADAFAASAVPAAVLVDANGNVASRLAVGCVPCGR